MADDVPSLLEREAMRRALAKAAGAGAHGDVPIGAAVLQGGELLATAANERELRRDPSAHAEVVALRLASARAPLAGATLVVTLEPCVMCAGAMRSAGIVRVVFGAFDPKAGACGSRYNLAADVRLGPTIDVVADVDAVESAALLREFFAQRRR